MKQNKNALYALAAVLTMSTAVAGIAMADADIEVKAYTPPVIAAPEPIVPAPQPVYIKEEVKPIVVEQVQKVVAEPQPVVVNTVYVEEAVQAQPVVETVPCNRPAHDCNMVVQPMPVQPAPMVAPQPEPVANTSAPCDGPEEECNRVPPADKDGSLFPGGKCSHCTDSKKETEPAPQPVAQAASQPEPFVYTGIPCDDDDEDCEYVPSPDKDGSLFPGGECSSCTRKKVKVPGTCNRCARQAERRLELRNYVSYTPVVYEAMQRNCCQMAPIALDHVDFRIKKKGVDGPYTSRLGNYRFRIFGCRRFNKEARLNSGRILEKNINFNTVFEEAVGDCYKVLPAPKDLCLQTVPEEMPEYILTAEITNYFMNVCDEYDWNNAEKKNSRNGTSEITVTWRLMNLTKSEVLWKGESTGYGELYDGEKNGENKLIERAFADAASNLRAMTGFEDRLMQRLAPQEIAAQRWSIIEEERALNPIKCGYRKEYDCAHTCEIGNPAFDAAKCQTSCGCTAPTCQAPVVEVKPEPAQPCYAVVEGVKVPAPCEQPVVQPVVQPIDTCYNAAGEFVENSVCRVVDDTWVDTGDTTALDTLCVTASNPCQKLTPETMYRMRSSVVQITSPNGRKGAGLLISDRLILTSGDLITPTNNSYDIKTVRNTKMSGRAVRINPSKNTALIMLDESTEYTPLALNLNLPEVGKDGFLTLGVLNVDDFKDGEDYLENSAKIEGYRYSEDKGAEILANTFIQNVTVGGALFYKDCTVSGMAHSGIKTDDGMDVYVPTETALRSLGISICNHEYVEESPWQQTIYKPVTQQIQIIQQAPEVMPVQERK